jgi:hypothetical protein
MASTQKYNNTKQFEPEIFSMFKGIEGSMVGHLTKLLIIPTKSFINLKFKKKLCIENIMTDTPAEEKSLHINVKVRSSTGGFNKYEKKCYFLQRKCILR